MISNKQITVVTFLILLLSATGCKESRDQKLVREAKEFTERNCPHTIDEYTTLDSATYNKTDTCYTYHFTIKGALDIEELYEADLVDELHDSYLDELKNNIEMKNLKDMGVTITRIYRSGSTGKPLMTLTFTKEEYCN